MGLALLTTTESRRRHGLAVRGADLGVRQAEAASHLLDSRLAAGASHASLPTLRTGHRRRPFSETASRTKSFTEFTQRQLLLLYLLLL